ncbi:ThiF family protein, partial [Aphelenchoides avenae]
NQELIANVEKLVPQEAVDEITRFGMSEPHVIAAILGGTVAQEAIKLATHQYVPVDNGLVYDGHSQCATAFRI